MDNILHADLHMHSRYSMDSTSALEDIVSRCLEMDINCIAITDHDALEGAIKLKEMAPFTVIPGEEILTPNGEIIGYFMTEYVPSNQPLEAVISALKAQGALVAIPHPFDTFRGLRNLDSTQLDLLGSQVDVVEVFNARTLLPGDSDKAAAYARKHGLPGSAGSDAHSTREIGRTYVEMLPFRDKEGFLKSLSASRIQRRRSSPFVHAYTVWSKVIKAL
jgi:predicted metal-dependent phosphoesterase TrpH